MQPKRLFRGISDALLTRDRFRDDHGGSALPWLLGIARNVLLELNNLAAGIPELNARLKQMGINTVIPSPRTARSRLRSFPPAPGA